MGRPPLAVGTFGKIDFLALVLARKRVRARASFRDFDGRRRFRDALRREPRGRRAAAP
jgi:hypothetical protein